MALGRIDGAVDGAHDGDKVGPRVGALHPVQVTLQFSSTNGILHCPRPLCCSHASVLKISLNMGLLKCILHVVGLAVGLVDGADVG